MEMRVKCAFITIAHVLRSTLPAVCPPTAVILYSGKLLVV